MIYKNKRKISAKILLKKKLTQKKLWTFEYPKIDLIFKSPYHNYF
jgi:hypothetical protein